LAPIEDSLAQLKTLHSELRDQVIEQNASLASVEDRLEMVREATDRNTRQQQELIEDLRDFGKKINFVAMTTLGLLAISVGTSVALLLKIFKIIP
jgi:t-SNARE complex subunit (syntaxin)